MTSIEFLFKELWETPKDKFEWCFILNKAKEMHNKEIEISDEEIKKAANNPNNDGYCFQEGARWYREQLKQI